MRPEDLVELEWDHRMSLTPNQVCEIAELMGLGLIYFDRGDGSFKGSNTGLSELFRVLTRYEPERIH
jgi:hypothetical protein